MYATNWTKVYRSRDGFASRIPALLLLLVFLPVGSLAAREDAGGASADAEPVPSYTLGPLELLVARAPARFAWLQDDRPVLAQRYRRRAAALEYRDAAGWHGLGALLSAEPIGGAPAADSSPRGWRFGIAAGDGREATVDCRWDDALGACVLEARLAGEAPAGWRFDVMRHRGEELAGVSPRVFARGAERAGSGAAGGLGSPPDGPPAEPSEAPRTRACVVFSSRGYGLVIPAAGGAGAEAFTPDPDTFRVETRGERFELRLVPGDPRDVLASFAALDAARTPRPGEPSGEAFPWASVAGWEPPSPARDAPAREAGSFPASFPGLVPLFVVHPADARAWSERRLFAARERLLLVASPEEPGEAITVFVPAGAWALEWEARRVVRGPAKVALEPPAAGSGWLAPVVEVPER